MRFQIPLFNFFLLPAPPPLPTPSPLSFIFFFKDGDRHHHSVLCTLSFLCRIVIIIFSRNKHEKLNIYHQVVFFFLLLVLTS